MDIICFLLKSVQEFIEIQRWLILTSFMFPQLSSTHLSYISYKTKKCRYVNKIFYKMDRKWMVAPFHQPLRQNLRWLFENSFYSQEKEHAFFWKTVLRIFEIALCLKDRYDFMWQPLEILNVFTTSTLKLIFWKTKTFLKKPGSCFLVQRAKIEIAIFLYKTALPEANAIRQIEWEVHNRQRNNEVWSVTTLFSWKYSFRIRTSSKELIRCTNCPSIFVLFVSAGVLFESVFSMWGSLNGWFPWCFSEERSFYFFYILKYINKFSLVCFCKTSLPYCSSAY